MASFKANIGKIIGLLILLIVILFGTAVLFNFLGLIRLDLLQNKLVGNLLGTANTQEIVTEIPLGAADPLSSLRGQRDLQNIQFQFEELERRKAELNQREVELDSRATLLGEKEKSIEDRDLALNQQQKTYDNRKKNLEQTATYLEAMPPASAVDILNGMMPLEVVDLLRTSERLALEGGRQSQVAFWFSLMPAARASEIQSLMTQVPAGVN